MADLEVADLAVAEQLPAATRVALFCGGRGGATLLRQLVRTGGLRLSLVVNGYDNGFSTGALRRYIPGLLGPSDFRKNVGHHLDPAEPHDAALVAILEHRLGIVNPASELARLQDALRSESNGRWPWAVLDELVPAERCALAAGLDAFVNYRRTAGAFDLADCSVANLVFAGRYLCQQQDFNATVDDFAALFGSPIRLLNVSNGENAFLTATKDDEVLADEADIVAAQSPAPIRGLDLLVEPVTDLQVAMLEHAAPAERHRWLQSRRAKVSLNPQAARAVRDADVLVFCAGTQHSSLLPTYLTPGLGEAVATSRASVKVFLLNIERDHDIQRLSAVDVLDEALVALGDPDNARGSVTHVLFHDGPDAALVPRARSESRAADIRGVHWVGQDLEDRDRRGVHDGRQTAAALARLYDLSHRAFTLPGHR